VCLYAIVSWSTVEILLIFNISYEPGDVIMFLSGSLFHGIVDWKPKLSLKTDALTPGRIEYVYFSHTQGVEGFERQEPGFFKAISGQARWEKVPIHPKPGEVVPIWKAMRTPQPPVIRRGLVTRGRCARKKEEDKKRGGR
jgi:hypothetical protein